MSLRKNVRAAVVAVIITMSKTKKIVYGAMIGALYAALTLLLAPISYGPVQFRISEMLTILPMFTPYAIPGLTVGCVVANLLGGFGLVDVLFGSAATLIGGLGTYYFRNKPVLAMLSPVVSNGIIVGSMLYCVVPDSPALLLNVVTVGIGELVICFGCGSLLIHMLKKHPSLFR